MNRKMPTGGDIAEALIGLFFAAVIGVLLIVASIGLVSTFGFWLALIPVVAGAIWLVGWVAAYALINWIDK